MTELPAGRELDALIAEKVFGKVTRKVRYLEGYSYEKGQLLQDAGKTTRFSEALAEEMDDGEVMYMSWEGREPSVVLNCVPHYSTDIAAAWEIMRKADFMWLDHHSNGVPPDVWSATFWVGPVDGGHCCEASADTAPLAICRAALKAATA